MGIFSVYLFKIGSIRCNTQVSTCFQLLWGVRSFLQKSCLAGQSRLFESLQLYQILHTSAATSPSGTGSSRWETNLVSMGVVQCCNLFLGQKLSNYCCRILNTVFVSSNLLLKSVEPQFSGCRVYLLLTEMSLFDLFDHFVDGGNVVIGSTCCGPTTAFVILHWLSTL